MIRPTASLPTAPVHAPIRRALRGLLALALVLHFLGCNDDGANAGETAVAADALISEIDAAIAGQKVDKTNPAWRTQISVPPLFKFDPAKKYFWKLKTNQGEVVFRMFPETAPRHVGTTFYLTRIGFYDGLGFHRVIKGFMAQGGDPLGNGRGGPGFKYYGEFDPKVTHDSPGMLSMANAGPGTDGSQFFITFAPTPALNGRHTVFGKAESEDSLATIRKMEALGRPSDPAPPTSPIVIERATVLIE
jgi:peptidyl-prolyl cis-trans isomerase B (cyclophilin B)